MHQPRSNRLRPHATGDRGPLDPPQNPPNWPDEAAWDVFRDGEPSEPEPGDFDAEPDEEDLS